MAELDIKGFVTEEQKFPGLYKLAEDMTAQNAAKAKATEAAKANQAALAKYAENKFNPKDYLSGTVADPNITRKLAEGIQQVNTFISQNKGATESQIQLFASPIISQVAQDSEKSKELKRQMELGLEQIKGMKGVDANKFRESFQNRAWGIKDGQLPDNLNNVDITHNYIDDVLNNDDIYNAEAVRESIKNAKPIEYSYSQTSRNKAGVQKATLYDAKSQPFYQPLTDASGKPTGDFEPKHETFTDNDAVVMHEWMGDDGQKVNAPIKLLDKDAFEQIFSPANNPAAAAYLRNEVKKQMQGKAPLNSSQAEALSRAIAYDLVRDNMTEPASIKLKEEQKQPIVKNYIGGSGGSKEPTINDIYTRLKNHVDGKLKQYKDNPKQFGNKDWVQVNTLDSDIRDIVLKEARAASGVPELGTSSIKIKIDENGTMGIYNVDDNSLIGQLTEQGLNVRASQGVPSKNLVIKNMKYKASNGKSYTHAQLIKMGYTDEAIKQAEQAGNLKTQ